MDLGLRPLPGSRREDGVPPVPRGLGRAARRLAALAARRRRGRPLHLERPDARRQAGRVLAPDEGQRPVQGVLALRTRLVERQRDVSLRALRPRSAPGASHLAITLVDKGSSPAQRPVVTAGKGGCADVVLNVDQPDGKRVVAAWQIFVGWSKSTLKVDHLRLHFDRLLVRRAMDPELRAGQAGLSREERVDAARADRERSRRVAAPLERRRHLGPLARDARRAGRLGLQGEAVASTSSSSAASRGRSSPSRASATSARCPAGTARASHARRAR